MKCECTEKEVLGQIARQIHELQVKFSDLVRKVETMTKAAEELNEALCQREGL
jgi:hypothetical protein